MPEISEASVREAGGSWYGGAVCTNGEKPSDANRTSAAATGNLDQAYKGSGIDHDDGLDEPMRLSRNATTGLVWWPFVGIVVVLAVAASLGIIGYRKRHPKQDQPQPDTGTVRS